MRKQVRKPHTESQLGSTTIVLVLVHMDLMGPMQAESIVGKRYVYVCGDDSPYSLSQTPIGPNQMFLKHLKNCGKGYPRSTTIDS